MDQMGEVDYAPGEPRGTDWHPHRGFETVTYMIDGTFQHQDSHGGGGVITNGATQWMTAGGGILHIETPPEAAGRQRRPVPRHPAVGQPAEPSDKFAAPRYQSLEADQVVLLASPDGGALVRLIAGDVAGFQGPGATHTPITVAHATVAPGAQLVVPWPAEFNALAYVLAGDGSVGAERRPVHDGRAGGVRRGRHGHASGRRHSQPLDVLLLGGQPIREPVAAYGPFVMNTRDELVQAVEDFQRRPAGHGAGRRPAPLPPRPLKEVPRARPNPRAGSEATPSDHPGSAPIMRMVTSAWLFGGPLRRSVGARGWRAMARAHPVRR